MTSLFRQPGGVPQSSSAAGIVDVAAAAAALQRGAVAWDVRDTATYQQGHLPGAVHLPEAERILRLPAALETDELALVEAAFSKAGLDLEQEIVVYATRGSPYGYAAAIAVRYFGGKRALVLHDGIEGWREAGQPVETGTTSRAPATVRLALDPASIATTDDVLAALNAPDVQLLDVRTPDEFAGIDVRAARGGHIPGAINIPYEHNWIDPACGLKLALGETTATTGMALKPLEALRQLYARLDPAKPVVVYCQSGARAAQTAEVLAALGFAKVRLYKRSWLEYAARADAPVAL